MKILTYMPLTGYYIYFLLYKQFYCKF